MPQRSIMSFSRLNPGHAEEIRITKMGKKDKGTLGHNETKKAASLPADQRRDYFQGLKASAQRGSSAYRGSDAGLGQVLEVDVREDCPQPLRIQYSVGLRNPADLSREEVMEEMELVQKEMGRLKRLHFLLECSLLEPEEIDRERKLLKRRRKEATSTTTSETGSS